MRFISLKVLVPLLCATVYFAGSCSFTKTDALNADIPFAKASYKLDGEVTEESCGVYIFFINFANLFGSDAASVQAGGGGLDALLGFLSGATPEEGEALYNALEKMPGATHLLKPRVKNTFTGVGNLMLPMFGERCAEVKAHAVTMGQPNPQQ